MDGHWTETFEHESITPDNREAFVNANSKYASETDALIGGYNAMTGLGKPYRIPEMDSLDDAGKADFTSKARTALGINIPKDVESLQDFDFKAGLADDGVVNETFVGLIKDWAVEAGIDTATLGKLVGFYNGPLTKFSQELFAAKEEMEFKARAEKGHEALLAHYNGDADKLTKDTESLRRVFQNQAGLTSEEYAGIADELMESRWNTHPIMNKALMNLLPNLSKEGKTVTGDGSGGGGDVNQLSPYETKKERWPKSPESEWGKPTDKWADMDIQEKKVLGYKEAS